MRLFSFSLNTLSSLVDLRRLWVPEVNFRNTEGNKMSRLDESSEGYVFLNGSFEYNTIRENREAKIYKVRGQQEVCYALELSLAVAAKIALVAADPGA